MKAYAKIMGNVSQALPQFENNTICEFRKREVNSSLAYMDRVWKEAMRYSKNEIQYLGYTILSPEHRLDELNDPSFRRGYNIQVSELILVRFDFAFENERIPVHIYLPYYKDDAITIDDTKYYIQLAIIDKVISRIPNGIILKVMRSPLKFFRHEQFGYVTTKGKSFLESIITTQIHWKRRKHTKKDPQTALLLYPLGKFGLAETLNRFGLTADDICFVEAEDLNAPSETVFVKIKENLYLKSRLELFTGETGRIIASLIYCLKFYRDANIQNVYDTAGTIWKIILGKSIHGSQVSGPLAHNHTEKHFASLSTYLDYLTQHELASMGIYCDDIYDLLIMVFKNIDKWIANYRPNNLYDKRLGVLELILSPIVEAVFNKMYDNPNDQKLTIKNVRNMLRVSSKKIAAIYTCGAVQGATVINDNAFLTILGKKIIQPISADKPGKKGKGKRQVNIITDPTFHIDTSQIVHESILSIPASNPGAGGFINPYSPIDERGNLLCPEYAHTDLEELKKYLPSRSR